MLRKPQLVRLTYLVILLKPYVPAETPKLLNSIVQ